MSTVLLLAALTFGDPPATSESNPAIRLPEISAPVLPPAPSPNSPTVLNADELYVFDSDVECFVAGYPAGLLKVTKEAGPLRVKAKFAGDVRLSTRTYKGPFVYTVEAVATGDVTLVVTPKGVATEKAILTRLISANVGPRPPPVPPTPVPPVPPQPVPPDPSLVTNPFGDIPGLHVLMVYETGATLPVGQGPVLFGKSVRDYLDAHCPVGPDGVTHEWRIYDAQVMGLENEAPIWKTAMGKPRAGVPWLYVGNGKAGESVPLPKTVEETLTILRKYGGS